MAGMRIEANGEALLTAMKLRAAACVVELSHELQTEFIEQQKHVGGAMPYIGMNLR